MGPVQVGQSRLSRSLLHHAEPVGLHPAQFGGQARIARKLWPVTWDLPEPLNLAGVCVYSSRMRTMRILVSRICLWLRVFLFWRQLWVHTIELGIDPCLGVHLGHLGRPLPGKTHHLVPLLLDLAVPAALLLESTPHRDFQRLLARAGGSFRQRIA